MSWDKAFANNVTNQGFISKICKQLIQLNIKKRTQSKKKKRVGRPKYFFKDGIQMAQRHKDAQHR